MSQYKYAEIADTVYFWFAANDTTGAAGDGATPLFDVRLAGAAAGAAPTASGTPTLLSHADYSAGLHEIAIDTTGYSAGEYAVFCTLTISTINPAGFCGSFKLRTAGTGALKVDTIAIGGTVQSATDLKDFADTGYDPATHKVAGVILADTCTTLTGHTAQTGDSFAIVNGDHGLVSIQDDIDAILLDTAEIGTAGAGLTAVPWNATWDAQVQSEVADALDAALPASPTGDSINDYLMRVKYCIVNKQEITEADGATVIYKDDDSTPYVTIAAAYSTNSTTTTKKKLE